MSKDTLLPLLASHVLAHGLGGASLRPLAKAAGTSDRMLLYHFGTKEALISDLLAYLARAYAGALDAALGEARANTRGEVLARILAQGEAPEMRPFAVLWWEIVAGSARGVPGYLPAAQTMMDELLGWLEGQMPAGDPDPEGGARYLLTMIEGAMMLAAIGHEATARDGLLASGLMPS
ncbi:TetR family transcriptional regulator [Porphyrobacter sp. HT-58-2]|uniref:TetR/AcrR family transcriptional regulator n=1 Tax=Porphyrobacter sp. HT-58-2 TaxID=2023229 RepID=UPI000CDCB62C|nr:TetR/AcrR family transcriptional regulator [Porphyrobacter sp. HT-58-2]AUX70244.1 TetR family transcriptional regulator [Porphyrobacter sp. HT-58-2]